MRKISDKTKNLLDKLKRLIIENIENITNEDIKVLFIAEGEWIEITVEVNGIGELHTVIDNEYLDISFNRLDCTFYNDVYDVFNLCKTLINIRQKLESIKNNL